MSIQIDQSGKIEDTSRPTILAASNSVKFSIVLSAKEKRRLQQKFRKIGYPRLFIDYVFAALLYILFTKVKRSQYIVDMEVNYQKSWWALKHRTFTSESALGPSSWEDHNKKA